MAYINRLKAFFMQNDPDRLYLAKKILKAFRHDEDVVMKRLEEIYSSGGPKNLTFKELKKSSSFNLSKDSDAKSFEQTSPIDEKTIDGPAKKKGKLKKIIVLFIVITALGGGGYFAYNAFMVGDHDESHQEETHSEGDHDSSVNHNEDAQSDNTTNENSSTEEKTVEEIESKINEAEKDSTIENIKDAAEAIHVIGK